MSDWPQQPRGAQRPYGSRETTQEREEYPSPGHATIVMAEADLRKYVSAAEDVGRSDPTLNAESR